MKSSQPLSGMVTVALKEGRASLLSPRLLIIASVLALAVLAGTFAIPPGPGGGSGTTDRLAYGFAYFPHLNLLEPEFALFAATPTGQPLSGLAVHLVNLTHSQLRPSEPEILMTRQTDASGWAHFVNLARHWPRQSLGLVLADESGVLYAQARTGMGRMSDEVQYGGLLRSHLTPLGGRSDLQTYSLVFLDAIGSPQENADVFIGAVTPDLGFDPANETPTEGWDPYLSGTTDSNGFFQRQEPLDPGEYFVRVGQGSVERRERVVIFGPPTPARVGPDAVLAVAGLLFVPLILPVMALALAYDAIARERAEGSLDLLLSKPVSRIGVSLGKLLGALGAMAVPVVMVMAGAVALAWALTGQAVTTSFFTGFLGAAFFLLFAYTLLFLAISALTRNASTALMVSVLFFLLFAAFWGLLGFLASGLVAQPNSVPGQRIALLMSLASPTGLYQQMVALSLPDLPGSVSPLLAGTVQQVPIAVFWPPAVLWLIVPFGLFVWAMKFRVTEG